MKKNFFLIAILAIFFILIFVPLVILTFSKKSSVINNQDQFIRKVCFKENCFEVELALTDEQRSRGLMFQKELAPNKGMLFIFDEEGIRGFWMKNTLIPLDIIWLNKNKEVVFIKKDAQPCGKSVCLPIIPPQKSRYVLEINSGLTDKMNIRSSDKASFEK